MERGLRAARNRYLTLTPVREMALRIGRRRDKEPVLLEILSDADREGRALFFSFGDLFLSPQIPPRFIAGPPVPKRDARAPERQGEREGKR